MIPFPQLIRMHAARRPRHAALMQDGEVLDYAGLDEAMDRVAAALQRDGLRAGDSVAIAAPTSIPYATLFLGALRAGVVVAPLAPSSTPEALAAMVADSGAKLFFNDFERFETWLAARGARPAPAEIRPESPFNIIYSSGTTGAPKGIVQSHLMRAQHVERGGARAGLGPDALALLSTPLYSNTTLVAFFPALGLGGTVVLMPKFDARQYLELAQKHRVTHTALVPVQYQRLMAFPDFERYDLSCFRMKTSTSAPFSAALKAEVLARWPGRLLEFYGMTEGGGTCVLDASLYPHKLHTVGLPVEGHDIRLIDEQGREVRRGAPGEVVGHSGAMMTGYHRQPDKTREAEWRDAQGRRFIRTGDIGRFDEDGFLMLVDRKKDLIISGGFNIYPSDLEAVIREHPDVAEVAVVGVPSERWGETPVAFVVGKVTEEQLMKWAHSRLGKMQRLAAVKLVDELPRSPIGKVLKRDLRDRWTKQIGV